MCDKCGGTEAPGRTPRRSHHDEDTANYIGASGGAQYAARPTSDADVLNLLFSYQPPNSTTIPKYAAINQAAKNFAEVVLQNCPPSADRSAAFRQIIDAKMTANRSIAVDGLSL